MWKFAALAVVGACNQRATVPRAPLSNSAPWVAPVAQLEWALTEEEAFARARELHRGVIAERGRDDLLRHVPSRSLSRSARR